MSPDREVLSAAASLIESGEPFVMITVIKAQGSTPRNAGARMIWRPVERTGASPSGTEGTIGGGQFEHLVIDAARRCFETRKNTIEHFVLGADADQCCGGAMDVFLEFHGQPVRAVVFGAGHVATALAQILAPTSLDLLIVDDRPEWASASRYAQARCVNTWDVGVAAALERPDATLAVVMTCSHDTDFALLRRLLDQSDSIPRFVGLIGSRSKRVCLFGRLVASGIDDRLVQRIKCPVGVGDTGKEPHAVAISIAAQLLMEATAFANEHAAR